MTHTLRTISLYTSCILVAFVSFSSFAYAQCPPDCGSPTFPDNSPPGTVTYPNNPPPSASSDTSVTTSPNPSDPASPGTSPSPSDPSSPGTSPNPSDPASPGVAPNPPARPNLGGFTDANIELFNPLGDQSIGDIFLAILDIIMVFAVPIVLFFIVWAGFLYVTAQGSEERLRKAHNALLYAVVGGLLVLGAQALLYIITNTIELFT